MPEDDPTTKSGPASRLRKTTITKTNPGRTTDNNTSTRLTINSSGRPNTRPSSRVGVTSPHPGSSQKLSSPTKNLTISSSPSKQAQPISGRPLWNSSRSTNNCGLNLNLGKPTINRTSPQKPIQKSIHNNHTIKNDVGSDLSFANTTFVSAASGFDENRRPISPSKFKSSQPILAGLGLGRMTTAGVVQQKKVGSGNDENKAVPLSSPHKLGSGDRKIVGYDPAKEPIKAFLRIRPPNTNSTPRSPYIEILNETEVLLTPPLNNTSGRQSTAHFNPSPYSDPTSSKYKFTRVYGPDVSQEDFFKTTGSPLVEDLLNGKSSLCFAYGVTASGKTYTIQGGLHGSLDPGLLPRTMDVLFNSIGDHQTDLKIRPIRLTSVEVSGSDEDRAHVLARHRISELEVDEVRKGVMRDETILNVDENSEYGVWISYAEVYNEKIYDLLDLNTSANTILGSGSSGTTFQSLTANITEQVKNVLQSKVGGGIVKRKALVLKHDKSNGHKYVHGLTEVRVRSSEEAKVLLRHGQINRSVFSTLANRTSSRSHGIFTIKLIRIPRSTDRNQKIEDLMSKAIVSRLSIVDLAGSERTRNTQTTGERLKEAGNINKSLMVLGQCMETLRRNQDGRSNLRKKKVSVVPFRHSRLTELFQSFFIGGDEVGKIVMIVNVNPYDTGYEENSHVMKFSAVASEVNTVIRNHGKVLGVSHQSSGSGDQRDDDGGKECSLVIEDEEEEEVGEEEDELGSSSEGGDDEFVNHLLQQISDLRVKLVEAEIRAAMVESEVREEVMQEYRVKMMEMEELFVKNLEFEAKEAELKTDRKIDIFNRATLHRSSSQEHEEEDEESSEHGLEDVEHGDCEPESPTPKGGAGEDDDKTLDDDDDQQPRRKLRSRVVA